MFQNCGASLFVAGLDAVSAIARAGMPLTLCVCVCVHIGGLDPISYLYQH